LAEATGGVSAPGAQTAPPASLLPPDLSLRGLLEVGAHFGHQTRRWDPRMRPYIFGERNGIHILNLDATHSRLREALDFLREIVARGGKVLFVATKRQAQDAIAGEAQRAGQFYVNNRWLGGMLTNFRTVKRSIERFKEELELLENEEKAAEVSKKERARIARSVSKYKKSLDGIREMGRLPDALFVIDVGCEHIALTEAQRLGIPIVAIVDSNCNPEGIDYVVPGNDDAIRAIQYYCKLVADACQEGAANYNERVQAEVSDEARAAGQASLAPGGRRVVEIRQAPRRGRGAAGGGHPGGGHSGGTHSAEGRRRRPPVEAEAPAAPAAPAAAAEPAEAVAPTEGAE
jgi:small subunit ribosomal protein S2